MQKIKWFIAILPPSSISNEIIAFQKEIEQKHKATHAQKVPPHITIIPPFEATEESVERLIESLEQFLLTRKKQSIEIQLDNFQCFESKTLFVDVAKNEIFELFCKNLKLLFNQQKIIKQRVEKHYFVPHITLANKDLKKKDFKLAWESFKERTYQNSFELEELTLLMHDGIKWIDYKKITSP